MTDLDTLVIGAGVIGLACARALAVEGREVMVLERNGLIGAETSARNSEVIHAGIYYPKDSLKARLCVEGRAALYRFCADNGVPHERIGKLIVAADDSQLGELDSIRARAVANGVCGLTLLDREALARTEPALRGAGALLSPETGIIDGHAYMLALQGALEAAGGQVVLNTGVSEIAPAADGRKGYRVTTMPDSGEAFSLTCRELVVCAGHDAPDLMRALPGARPPRAHLAKGSYFRLQGKAPFSRLIYPVPEPGGLGIHLTLDLQHQARFGPDVEWVDSIDYRVDPSRAARFLAAIRSYWPDLGDDALVPDYAGIRPKISAPGAPAADFRIDGPASHHCPGLVALYGIESPGLTSSLAIARHVCALLRP